MHLIFVCNLKDISIMKFFTIVGIDEKKEAKRERIRKTTPLPIIVPLRKKR